MARNPKSGDSSASTSAPAKPRSSRASNPPRAAASKRTKYFEDDIDAGGDGEEAGAGADLGGLPAFELDEEDEEERSR